MSHVGCWSGGGEKIAFFGGVYKRQEELGIVAPNQVGVSSGALISYAIQLGMSADDFIDFLLSIKQRDVYKSWWFGWFEGLFRGSLWNAKPLYETLKRMFDEYGGFKHEEPATPYVNIHQKELIVPVGRFLHPAESTWASAAHPVALSFPSVIGQWTTDGGVIDVTPVRTAIQLGATRLSIVTVAPEHIGEGDATWEPSWWERTFKLVSRTLREFEILSEQAQRDDIKHLWNNNDLAAAYIANGRKHPKYRYIENTVVRPHKPLNMTKLKFKPDEMQRAIDIGYEAACGVYG